MAVKPPISKLESQKIYYPGTNSHGVGTIHAPYWNDKQAWGTIGSEGQERHVEGHNVKLENGLLISAEWSVVEERRGG